MRYLSKDILEEVITQRPSDSYKSNFGRVVLIGGNRQYGGAIIMSTEACINSGAGLTTVITDVKNHGPLHARCPEAMVVGFEETNGRRRASGGYFNWSRFRLRCYCTTNIKDGTRPTSKTTMVNYRWLSNYPV